MPDTVEIPVVWLQGAACTGCAVSLLNSFAPGVGRLVLGDLVPGKHLSLRFIMTVMAGQGQQVVDVLKDLSVRQDGGYFLVMEGALSLGSPHFAMLGEIDGREVPIREHAARLARGAAAVVAMGTCASFGGIPAGARTRPRSCRWANCSSARGSRRPSSMSLDARPTRTGSRERSPPWPSTAWRRPRECSTNSGRPKALLRQVHSRDLPAPRGL